MCAGGADSGNLRFPKIPGPGSPGTHLPLLRAPWQQPWRRLRSPRWVGWGSTGQTPPLRGQHAGALPGTTPSGRPHVLRTHNPPAPPHQRCLFSLLTGSLRGPLESRVVVPGRGGGVNSSDHGRQGRSVLVRGAPTLPRPRPHPHVTILHPIRRFRRKLY